MIYIFTTFQYKSSICNKRIKHLSDRLSQFDVSDFLVRGSNPSDGVLNLFNGGLDPPNDGLGLPVDSFLKLPLLWETFKFETYFMF